MLRILTSNLGDCLANYSNPLISLMYLLDTNVVSELRNATSGKASKNVVSWANGVLPMDLFLSSISILELEIGVLRVERRDQSQGKVLRSWLDGRVLPAFSGRILSIDTEVARRCAHLHIPDPCSERDALITATALVHKLTVVTRNITDFEASGVSLLNPW